MKEEIYKNLEAVRTIPIQPEYEAFAEKQISETSISEAVLNWLRYWKCTTSSILQFQLIDGQLRSKDAFDQGLKRLKKTGSFHSVRVGSEAYYFHDAYKKHYEALEAMNPTLRSAYLETNGIAHHIDIQNAFLWLRMMTMKTKGKVFAVGPRGFQSQFRSGLDVQEDLGIVGAVGHIPIEVERNQKTQKRWQEKWLEYECKDWIPGCIYLVNDPSLAGILTRNILEFIQDAEKRGSNFWIGLNVNLSDHLLIFSPKMAAGQVHVLDFFKNIAFPEAWSEELKAVPEAEQLEYLYKKADQENSKQN